MKVAYTWILSPVSLFITDVISRSISAHRGLNLRKVGGGGLLTKPRTPLTG